MKEFYKLELYVPDTHLEQLKAALFEAGAGRIGNYDRCCWQSLGRGQFRALEGSDPFIGAKGEVHSCDEWKLELVCESECLDAVVEALKRSHPYETPAYQFWKVCD